ncbi:MAG: lysylphosphatidylglycerol synthase domain-containing protein [Mycobacteriales bacterium]
MRGLLRSRTLRVAFAVVALALLVVSAATQWGDIRPRVHDLGAVSIGAALLAVLAGLWCSLLSWRAVLADLGSPLTTRDAERVFFVGQLGKYLPGSLWPILAQMELGRDLHVPRRRSAAAAVVIFGINVVTGAIVALGTLPLVDRDALGARGWALLAVPVGIALLHPRVVNPALNRGLRLLRREPLDQPLTYAGLLRAAAWALAMWLCYGGQLYLLLRDLDASGARLVPLAVGAFALAWVVGFLFVIAPAGAGVREGTLVVALGGALAAPAATLVALVSRLLMTIGDLVWGGLAIAWTGRRRLADVARAERDVAASV